MKTTDLGETHTIARSATPLQRWKADRLRRRVAKVLGMPPSSSERAILGHVADKVRALRAAEPAPAVSEQLAVLLGLAESLRQSRPPADVQPAAALADPAKTVELTPPLQAVRAAMASDA